MRWSRIFRYTQNLLTLPGMSGQDSFSAAEDMPQLKFENCGVFFIKIEFVENLINLNKIDSVRKLLLLLQLCRNDD